jgi:hypothetical protein
MTFLQHLIVLIKSDPLLFLYCKPDAGRKCDCLIGTEAEYRDILRDVTQHSERNHSSRRWNHFKTDFKTVERTGF